MVGNVLSINGNPSMNYLLKTVVGSHYNLVPVRDVLEGMRALKRIQGIDCVLIDIDYQPQENLDFILHLKTSFLYDCRIIVLASKREGLDPVKSRVQKIFFKPFNPLDIIESINQLMRTYEVK